VQEKGLKEQRQKPVRQKEYKNYHVLGILDYKIVCKDTIKTINEIVKNR
jgi:hypothetical protein